MAKYSASWLGLGPDHPFDGPRRDAGGRSVNGPWRGVPVVQERFDILFRQYCGDVGQWHAGHDEYRILSQLTGRKYSL